MAKDWKTLSEPVLLAEVDFRDIGKLFIDNTAMITANASGQLDGILEYFELELSPTTYFSTHPTKVDKDNHWRSPIWVFVEPLLLNIGDQFEVTYRYRITEDKISVIVSRF